jgi:hypothetical protein
LGIRPGRGAGLWFLFGPTSFVAAEIHLGRWPAGICDGWLHCNIQVACQIDSLKILFYFNWLFGRHERSEAGFIAHS